MLRIVVVALSFLTVTACATDGGTFAEDAARAECQAQGATEGQALRLCMDQIEEAVRVARENGGAPPPPHSQQRPPPR
jgi:hypothetical protein